MKPLWNRLCVTSGSDHEFSGIFSILTAEKNVGYFRDVCTDIHKHFQQRSSSIYLFVLYSINHRVTHFSVDTQLLLFVLSGLSFSFTVFRCNFVLTHRSIAFGYMAGFLCVHWFASNFVYFSVRQILICQLPRYYKQFVLVLLLRSAYDKETFIIGWL